MEKNKVDCPNQVQRRKVPETTVIDWDAIIQDFFKRFYNKFASYLRALLNLFLPNLFLKAYLKGAISTLSSAPGVADTHVLQDFLHKLEAEMKVRSTELGEYEGREDAGVAVTPVLQDFLHHLETEMKGINIELGEYEGREDELYELIVHGDEPNRGLYVYDLELLGTESAIGYLEKLLFWDYPRDNPDLERVNSGAVCVAVLELMKLLVTRDKDRLVSVFLNALEHGNDAAKRTIAHFSPELNDRAFLKPVVNLMETTNNQEVRYYAALGLMGLLGGKIKVEYLS